MPINGISQNTNMTPFPNMVRTPAAQSLRGDQQASVSERIDGIGSQVKGAIDHVNELQTKANDLAENVVTGKSSDVHSAVIAMEHALMALDFTMQVRNKMLDAYQEIMRTQL